MDPHQTPLASGSMPPDVDRLVHELGVHQVELEMQNEELRQAHAAIEYSRDRYADLYENAPVGYVTAGVDGSIVEANRLASALLSQRPESLTGRNLADFVVPADRLRFRRQLGSLVAGAPAGELELSLVRAGSGTPQPLVHVALGLSLVDDPQGPLCRVTLVDVSERVELQNDLRRMAAIVTSSEDAIVGRDPRGIVTTWNGGAEKLFGRAAAEMIGRPLDALVPEARRGEEAELLRRAAAGERLATVETERLYRDGSALPVSLSVSPIRDEHGRVAGSALIARDIGDRKRAERALHKRMRQLDLLSQAGQALIMGDPGETPVPAALFDRVRLAIGGEICVGYAVGDDGKLRMQFSHGLSPACRDAMAVVGLDDSMCGLAAQRRAPLIVEDLQRSPLPAARQLKAEGARSYAGFPLVAHGEVLGVAAFASTTHERFRDGDLQVIQTVCDQASAMLERARLIAALNAREQSLRLVDRRKDDFIATLAHELRNPLAPIRNAVDILRRRGLDDPQLGWCRDVIERQVTQMTHLLEDLLDVSRVTRNKIELRRERVELRRVIDEALETTQPLIQAQRHTLVLDLPDEPLTLFADPTRLTQVLANLLNNAAKYTDPGGRIELSVRRQDNDEVRIAVRDNGIGIESPQLARVFEMFSQLEPAIERSRGGLGIGLSLSRGLVELHGGRLEAHSEGVGCGSEFVVTLPVVHAQPEPDTQTQPGRGARADGVRVLVIDDNADAAQTLAMMLGLQGMEARAALGGLEGLALAEQWHPDVAVVDIGMPDLNGYEVCRRLRALPWGDRLMVVACTGWGQSEDRERARAAGFDHHLVKPIDPDAVQRLVEQARQHGDLPV